MTGWRESEPIVLATRNPHKLAEVEEILAGWEVRPLPEEVELPPEDAESFAGNAAGKAWAAHRATGGAVLADDSGIEAAALDGRPGVHSARFAGADASDEANLRMLLAELTGSADRGVAYVCAIVHISAAGVETVHEARCEGTLATKPRGEGGFGYDPAFIPVDFGDGRTMAELTAAEKHSISHRGRALRAIAAAIGSRDR